jgi:alpha-D-ribose 1-methylphosphonate 5-triphosphate diphosphatase PhnM
MSMALHSEHSEDGTIHLHIDFSHQFASRLVSDQDHMALSRQTWGTADFFSLFQRSEYFLKQQELDRLEKERLEKERLEKERLENEMVERMKRSGRRKIPSHSLFLFDGDGKPRKKRAGKK